MAEPTPVTPRRLHEQVVRAITERIVAGELRTGDALPSEAEMCVEYGVSRSSVREALRVLAEKGLIEVRHGLGTRVNPPERWDFLDAMVLAVRRERGAMVGMIKDLLEARRVVECEVTALAAERATEADCQQLALALETMRHSAKDAKGFAEGAFSFHRALLEATANRVLVRMAEPIRQLLEYSLQTTDSIPNALERALADHQEIYRLIAAHDVEGARAAMQRHLEQTWNDVLASTQQSRE
ncbi:MAG: FadR family transcriptional regulator [Candidatus Eremiobacteraeota bacterium]|nr:FadR family transcriptional regulator [Candidatus Eremiobacteraeota bacterium]